MDSVCAWYLTGREHEPCDHYQLSSTHLLRTSTLCSKLNIPFPVPSNMSSTESGSESLPDTTKNDKGKGKETAENHEESLPVRNFPGSGLGFLVNGKFHCHCEGNPKAKCLTVRTVSKDTHGKKCKFVQLTYVPIVRRLILP